MTDTSRTLADHARRALARGWHPIPCAGDKTPAIPGLTGAHGIDLTADTLDDAFANPRTVALGIRMPAGVIGIDVDHYDDKRGYEQLGAYKTEHVLPRLPDTWTTTSRVHPSGIRFYMVPAGIRFQSAPVPGVEIIQRHHRHAMVAPSRHPKTGEPYQWISPDGETSSEPPWCEQLEIPDLPTAWVHALADTTPADTEIPATTWTNPNRDHPHASLDVHRVIEWIDDAPPGGRHDRTLQAVAKLWRLDQLQHPGTGHALERIRRTFIKTVGKDRPGAVHHEWDAIVNDTRTYIATHAPRDPADTYTPWAMPDTTRRPFPAPEPPPFPLDILPPIARNIVDDITTTIQVPPDLPAICALGVLATILTPHIVVEYEPGWEERTNLYLAVAIPPSGGKSPVFKQIFAPVTTLEQRLADQARDDKARADAQRKVVERNLAAAEKTGDAHEIYRLNRELLDLPTVTIPRLRCDDQTPEAFVALIAEQDHVTVASTEGGLFANMGRYTENGEAQLDPYLKAWSGDAITVDRRRSDPIQIARALASVCITVQPKILQDLGQSKDFQARGLPQRFMVSIPATNIGQRDRLTRRPIDPAIHAAWHDTTVALGERWAHIEHPKVIRFTPDAWELVAKWRQDVEHRRVDDLEPLAEWAAKLESSVIRVAGILWATEPDRGDAIDIQLAERAIVLGNYWIDHAKALLDLTNADDRIRDAREVWRIIETKKLDAVTPRILTRHNQRRFPSAEVGRAAIEMLASDGWLLTTESGEWVPVTCG